tara:strand:+ start:1535 stop:1711 length:177 start_codon:yes stop_codon:yes gene_type:complete
MTIYAIAIPYNTVIIDSNEINAAINPSGLTLHPRITSVFGGEWSYYVLTDGITPKTIQ